jgi:hypothetical protein
MNGGIGVAVGSCVKVGVDVGTGKIVMDVDAGGNVGFANGPGPQLEIAKIAAKKQTGIIRRFVFTSLLLQFSR